MNLKDAGRVSELGDGTFFTALQRKLSESLLTRSHRWVFESGTTGSVEILQGWVAKEAELKPSHRRLLMAFLPGLREILSVLHGILDLHQSHGCSSLGLVTSKLLPAHDRHNAACVEDNTACGHGRLSLA